MALPISQFRATPELTLGAGLTHFLKYEYTDYTTLSGGAAEIARVGNCTPVTTAILSGTTYQAQTVCQLSRNGNKLEDTPAMALALNASYRRPFGRANRSWFADLDMSYTGQRFLEDDNTIWLDSYWNTNIRFGIEGERWSATVYCDNVFDDDTVRSAGTGPGNIFADVRTGARSILTQKGGEKISYASARFGADDLTLYALTDKDSEFRRLVKIDVATGKHTPLTQQLPWDVDEFEVSPDGALIAFVTNENGAGVLHLLDAKTGQERAVPKLPLGTVSSLEWHNNSRDLAFNLTSAKAALDV